MNERSKASPAGRLTPAGIAAAREFIEAHPDRNVRLDEVAFYAALSPFHFQRRFTSDVGETPHSYARRLRLERAAFRLWHEADVSVLDIALDAGYETHESFTRAFRGLFGAAPQVFRHRRAAEETIPTRPAHIPFVRIENFAGLVLRYERIVGPYTALTQNDLRERRRALLHQSESAGPALVVGICHDDPQITPPERLRFDLGIRGEGSRCLPAGPYVVARHAGPYQLLNATYRYLIDGFPRTAGRRVDAGPCFEVYLSAPDAGERCELDVYVPLCRGL